MVVVAGFGNPLLDITVTITDRTLLQKYNLNDDDQVVIAKEQMKLLLNDISDYPVEYSPGGCAQNTMRILQWLLNKPNSTFMFGSIGDDEQGKNLKTLVENAGVQTRYIVNKSAATGTSVALVNGANRSLVAYIGAAEIVTVNDIVEATKNGRFLDDVDLLYMEGFFLPDRRDTAMHLLKAGKDRKITFAFNISAPYLCRSDPDTVKHFAENCDILFGNRREFEALGKVIGGEAFDAKGVAVRLAKSEHGRTIVVTNGSESVLCVHGAGCVVDEIAVPKIDPAEMGDTTGAGDAFVAGFLTGLFEGRTPRECLTLGCWSARQIIKQVGCRVPDYPADVTELR